MLLLFYFSFCCEKDDDDTMCCHHPLLVWSCRNVKARLLMVIVVWSRRNKRTITNIVLALVLAIGVS